MKHLCDGQQDITAAHHRKITSQRTIIWRIFVFRTFHRRQIMHRKYRFVVTEIMQWILVHIPIDIAIIDFWHVIFANFHRMRTFDPLSFIRSIQRSRWFAPKIAWIRYCCRKNHHGHKPWCWYFAQKHNQHRTNLPFSKIAQCFTDHIDFLRHFATNR